MVNFCDDCGSLLVPKQNKRNSKKESVSLYCNLCKKFTTKGFKEISYQMNSRIPHSKNDQSIIIEEEFNIYPKIKNTCPKCGYHEAYYWEGGDRRKQEWEHITYYKCIKCKKIWF